MRKHVLPKIPQNKLLPAVTRANIKEIFKEARLAKVGARTRQVMRNIPHKAFEDAVVLGSIQGNPVVGIKMPYTPQERDNLTILKSRELIRVSTRTRYKNLIKIGLVTGLQMGELIGLRWDDVDFEAKCIYVREQVQRQENKDKPSSLEFALLKTMASKRTIALGNDSIQVLYDQKELLEIERALAKGRWKEFGLVFPSLVGTPMEQTTLRNAFNRFLKKAGLDETIHFHDLRHASISAIRSKKVNADIATAMKHSGHSQTETLDHYTHDFADEENYNVAEKLDELILGE
jgi:integrase